MSGHLQGRLLKMLTQMIKPRRALELGAFAGYSSLCIAEGLPEDSTLDTVEIDDELEEFLTSHFSKVEHGSRIKLHIADASVIVPRLGAEGVRWDLVFIDADKRLYPDYYRLVMPFVNNGGWIIVDNTLWNGKVLAEKAGNPNPSKKNDSQLEGVMEFNRMVAADSRVEKVIVPVRDGLTIIHVLDNDSLIINS